MPAIGGQPKKPKTPRPSRAATSRSVQQKKGTAVFPAANRTAKLYGPGPVKVYVAKTSTTGTDRTVKAAARAWNKASGKKVFVPTTKRKQADVVVQSARGVQKATGKAAYTSTATKKGRKTRVVIDSKWAGNSPNLAAHELGHAAGLAHPNPRKNDEYSNSRRIMGSGTSVTKKEARAAAALQRSRKLKAGAKKSKAKRVARKKQT